MKITASSDWRDGLAFDAPVVVADVMPGDPARCAMCGTDAAPLPRDELWVVKHRHPNNPAGFVRFYCAAHRPRPEPRPASVGAPARAGARPARERRAAAPRKAPVVERPRTMCPDCFVEVPATGVCGMCGQRVG